MDTDSYYISLRMDSLHDCFRLERKWFFYERFHEWFPSEACDVRMAKFVDIMTCLGLCAWYLARQCCEALQVYDKKTPDLLKTEWDGNGMVALSSKTYYCRDSQGQDKLSSKGLQKKANANDLTIEAYRCVLSTGLLGGGVNRGIRVRPSGQVCTYWQARTALSYVYLKRCVVDNAAPVSCTQPACLPAYLPAIWLLPAQQMLANMR